MENFNLRIGLFVVFILAACFAGYEYNKASQDKRKAIMPTDRVAMTVKIDYIYEDSPTHNVDLLNPGTSEKYFDIPVSKKCPNLSEFDTSKNIDVIKIDYIDGQTGETWSEFDGLYQRVCWGKSIYNHSEEYE